MMRLVAALLALLVAGCSVGAGPTPEPATPAVTSAPVTPAPATPSAEPSLPPSASPVANTVFTADDAEIASVVKAGAEEAVPQLRALNDADPSKLEDLFLPLGDWITGQRAAVQAFTPSNCTADAVDLFEDGLGQYDAIRKKFLAWRDWGATGHAFPPGAPREAATAFEDAVAELDAHCTS
jgi:hypothetical protein